MAYTPNAVQLLKNSSFSTVRGKPGTITPMTKNIWSTASNLSLVHCHIHYTSIKQNRQWLF